MLWVALRVSAMRANADADFRRCFHRSGLEALGILVYSALLSCKSQL